jgi:hypothetical protein
MITFLILAAVVAKWAVVSAFAVAALMHLGLLPRPNGTRRPFWRRPPSRG